MARGNRGRGKRPKTSPHRMLRETVIPKAFLDEQFSQRMVRIEGSVLSLEEAKTGNERKEINRINGEVAELRSKLSALLQAVSQDGFARFEQQKEFCDNKDSAVAQAKRNILEGHKQGDPRLNGFRKNVTDELVRQQNDLTAEVNRVYKLPKSKKTTVKPEALTDPEEILAFVESQFMTIISQAGLTNIFNALNEKSTAENPNYFTHVVGILMPVLSAIAESLNVASERFISEMTQDNWSGKLAAGYLADEINSKRDEVYGKLHDQMPHQDISVLIGRIKVFYRNIGKRLRGINTSKQFKAFESDETDKCTQELYESGKDNILQLYCRLRDENIEKHGEYIAVLSCDNLATHEAAFKELCTLQKDGFYEVPDLEWAELIATEFNESFHDGSMNFLRKEDVIKIIQEINWEIQKDKATNEELSQIIDHKKHSLKELIKGAINDFFESIVGKVGKGVRLQLSLKQSNQRADNISVPESLYMALYNVFEQINLALYEKLEEVYEQNVKATADGDEVEYINHSDFEKQLKEVVKLMLPELVAALNKEGLEIEESDLAKYLEGTQINIAALPYNVGTIADPISEFEQNTTYHENILRALLQDRYVQDGETLFTPREKDDLIRICTTLTKSSASIDVADLLSRFEEEGRFEEWAGQLNKRHHAGHPVRNAASVVREATEVLQNLADQLSEGKKASRIDEGLQTRIDEATQWATQYFEDKQQRVDDKVELGKNAVYRENPTQKMIRRLFVTLTESLDAYSLPDIERMVAKLNIFKNNITDKKGVTHNDRSIQLSEEEFDDLILPSKREDGEEGISTFYPEPDEIQGLLRTLDTGIIRCRNKLRACKSNESDLTELIGRLSTAKQELEGHESELAQAETDLAALTTRITEEMDKGSEANFGLVNSLSGKSAEKQDKVKVLKDVISELEDETTKLDKRIAELSEDNVDPEVVEDLINAKKQVRANILAKLQNIIGPNGK